MADRIEVVNGVGQMAFRSVVPWHGKGYGLTDEDKGALSQMSPAERAKWWLKVAQCDFVIQRRMLAMRQGDGTGLMVDPLKGYRAIVREDTNEVYQIATTRYQPVQNLEIVSFFNEYCEAGGCELETVGAIDGGRKIWALAKLANDTVGEGDHKTTYALIATSHDGTIQTIAKGTDVYVVCWNTLSAAIGYDGRKMGAIAKGEFRLKHSTKFTEARRKEAQETIGIFREQSQHATEVANKLSRVSIDDRGRVEFIQRLLGGESILEQIVTDSQPVPTSGLLDAMIAGASRVEDKPEDLGRLGKALLEAMASSPGSELVERKGTLWGAVNGVTYHVDHERGRNQDNRLDGAWFGDGDRLKRDAVRVALEIAG